MKKDLNARRKLFPAYNMFPQVCLRDQAYQVYCTVIVVDNQIYVTFG